MKNEYNLMRFGYEIGQLMATELTKDCKFTIDYISYTKFVTIRKAVKRHKKLCEDGCNLPNFDFNKIEKQEAKITKLVNELPIGLNLKIDEFQQDPRGHTVKFNNYWFNSFIWGGY